ncbi:MAG: hypothetical protein ABI852_22095, partial [Gemmatimonadaceae bacterium]
SENISRSTRSLKLRVVTAFVVMASAVTGFLWFLKKPVIDVALLPLAGNGSSNSWALETDRMVTDGLVEALTNLQSPKLGVHGPASTAVFAGSNQPQTEIGLKLRVQYVISGGVRLSDSTLFVQAVRVSDGRHVFAWREPVHGRSASELAQLIATGFGRKIASERP